MSTFYLFSRWRFTWAAGLCYFPRHWDLPKVCRNTTSKNISIDNRVFRSGRISSRKTLPTGGCCTRKMKMERKVCLRSGASATSVLKKQETGLLGGRETIRTKMTLEGIHWKSRTTRPKVMLLSTCFGHRGIIGHMTCHRSVSVQFISDRLLLGLPVKQGRFASYSRLTERFKGCRTSETDSFEIWNNKRKLIFRQVCLKPSWWSTPFPGWIINGGIVADTSWQKKGELSDGSNDLCTVWDEFSFPFRFDGISLRIRGKSLGIQSICSPPLLTLLFSPVLWSVCNRSPFRDLSDAYAYINGRKTINGSRICLSTILIN